MCSEPVKQQNQYITTNLINQQPIWLNMTFSRPFIITCKAMISVFCI